MVLVHFLQNEHNDLQETVIKMYPNIGKIIKVKIESTNQNSLFGQIENDEDMRAA